MSLSMGVGLVASEDDELKDSTPSVLVASLVRWRWEWVVPWCLSANGRRAGVERRYSG